MKTLSLLIFSLLCTVVHGQKANPERMEQHILTLAEFGKNPQGGVSRTAYSEADLQGRDYIISVMKKLGLKVRIDAAGNIIGRREGKVSGAKTIMFGSHIDSVPMGGNYDGDVGVIGALECIYMLNEQNIVTSHPIEVIVFSNEEGGLVGSSAIAGILSSEGLQEVSHTGLTLSEGTRKIGGDPENIGSARIKPGDLKAFIELHIEQGAILHDEGIDIGVVEGIVGIRWWDVTITGKANHAGTTPMDKRNDALVGASAFVIAANEVGIDTEGRQVVTVGKMEALPGAPNVIPGQVNSSLEIRDLSWEKIDQVYQSILFKAREIEKKYDIRITFDEIELDILPAPTHEVLRTFVAQSAETSGLTYQYMPSGAGHDAQDMTKVAPTAMIFVPSVGGISHSPVEFTKPQDMANGATVLYHTILKIDRFKGKLD